MPASTVSGRARGRRFLGLGRRRVERLAASLPPTLAGDLAEGAQRTMERGRELVDGLVDDAPPVVGRALRRRASRRRRAGGVLLLLTALLAIGAVVAWLAWREPRDEEFARLRPEPDEPNIAPAGTDGPAARAPEAPVADPADIDPGASWLRPSREPAGVPASRAPLARAFSGPALPRPVTAPTFAAVRAPLPPTGTGRTRLPV